MANGTYTNSEIIGSLINDLNELIKSQTAGEHIKACSLVVGMTQKLVNLRKTIDDDIKSREETISHLKEQLRSAGVEIVEVSMEEENGN